VGAQPPDASQAPDAAGQAQVKRRRTGMQEDTRAQGFDSHLFRRIVGYLKPYRGWVVLALALVVGVAYLGPLRPYLVQVAIDEHIVPGDLGGLMRVIGLLVGALMLEGVLAFAGGYLTQWIGQNAIYDLRTRVFDHIVRQPLRFFDRQPIGRLITRTTSDVESLSDVLSQGVVTILGDLGRLFFIGYFMFSLDATLALVSLSVMPLMVWATMTFRKKVRVQYRETRKHVARLNAFLQEHVTGMGVVQLFGREEEEARRFAAINDDNRRAQIKTIFYFALFWPAVEIIAAVALGLVLWTGGLSALGGGVTLGVLVAFIQYVRQFFEPIRNLSDQYNTLQSAMAGAERIFGVLDTDEALTEPERAPSERPLRGRIAFEDVWFTYDRDLAPDEEPNWILKGVSFVVEPGRSAAFVGATGAGKSTIIGLLLRFYDVQKGRITVDGVDVRDYPLETLRRGIGLVLQDVFLFSGTIERNITLGEDVPRERVEAAARLIGADRFIERLPQGYDQDVRERGANLSHGQRQLLSFVRAVVYNPAVLVLDEATSSVDTETEEIVQRALETLLEGRTSLVVAHRLSTIQHSDQILVMHRGEIRERGTHQELLAMNGLYRRLYELQYREQERGDGQTGPQPRVAPAPSGER
jgi:ATP-binding cassette subfamily B protein